MRQGNARHLRNAHSPYLRQSRELVAPPLERLVDARIPVQDGEQTRPAISGLRGAEEKVTLRQKGIMQHLANLLLHLAIEVDHQIAAGDEVDARERWIAQHAVEREH